MLTKYGVDLSRIKPDPIVPRVHMHGCPWCKNPSAAHREEDDELDAQRLQEIEVRREADEARYEELGR